MLFLKEQAAGLADGTITLTYRTWAKPQAKAGGRYRTWGLLLEVDDVRQVDSAEITDTEARRAGSQSAAALREHLAKGSNGTVVWRVQFRCIGIDDRIARRNDAVLDDERRATIQSRLDRLDRASGDGPWTGATLRLIAKYPGIVSTTLARHAGQERPAFKLNVRKLKELGLTESLEVGYRLSPLGEAFVNSTSS